MATVEVGWLRAGVMEFVYDGVVTEADLVAAIEKYDMLTSSTTPKVQFVDTLGVRGVPPTMGTLLSGLLASYREAGGEHVVMAASNQLNQMLGRSMSFGAGLKLAPFASREEALDHVKTLVD